MPVDDIDWELMEGVPQLEDSFIQKYLKGRRSLIEEEHKQRHDVHFRKAMSSTAIEACRIVSQIRAKEMKKVWTKDLEEDLAQQTDEILYPGMMFRLAKDRMESTELWKIVEKMPKGSLLHGHLEAMVNLDLLVKLAMTTSGIHIASSSPLAAKNEMDCAPIYFQYISPRAASSEAVPAIWETKYKSRSFVPIQQAASSFPNGGVQGFCTWLKSRCTIAHEVSLSHHHGIDAIWSIFRRTFQVVDSILYYEPIFRTCLRHMLAEIHADGIRYVDFRLAFDFQYQREGCETFEHDYTEFFCAFGEEIENFKASDAGRGFYGARMIWTTIRRFSNRIIVENMKQCISTKKKFPDLIAGFDLVGQEDEGRPLVDLIPVLFWFRKRCVEEDVDIPFFFHAGECLGDGDEADHNLYDAILLGTRRIGHAFSLYKHPLLIDLIKERKILVECCPISNEILRLTSSVLTHPLPALLSRGVPVSLSNDDPTILGHGKNGLTHDFWQVLNGLQNTGLAGLATMAENSIRWSCFEDQTTSEWLRDIREGVTGGGLKAARLKDWHVEFEKFCQWVVFEFGSSSDDVDP